MWIKVKYMGSVTKRSTKNTCDRGTIAYETSFLVRVDKRYERRVSGYFMIPSES